MSREAPPSPRGLTPRQRVKDRSRRVDQAFVEDWDRVVLDGRTGTLTWHKSEDKDD